MNLRTKKQLASKVLKVGKNKIHFNSLNLAEIKEAITRQDILDLYNQGIISIKLIKGRRKIIKKKTRRGQGKIKMKVNKRKQSYVKITRKLRAYLQELKSKNKIDRITYKDIRKKIKTRTFKSKANLKEYIESLRANSREDTSKPEKIVRNFLGPENQKDFLGKPLGFVDKQAKEKKITKKTKIKEKTK
ncbi:MAG: 50S ribosomal protein L19e [Nanoarchaeota archaeon]